MSQNKLFLREIICTEIHHGNTLFCDRLLHLYTHLGVVSEFQENLEEMFPL